MSKHLRIDKTCLNCGNTVEERFCTHCGQENLELKESFGHLFRHFFEDLTHYDSKLFTTMKDLLFKPGFLTKEYLAGRRSKYLHPIRMYVFISFLYFLALLSFNHAEERIEEAIAEHASLQTKKQIAANLHVMLLTKSNDTLADKTKEALINTIMVSNKLDSLPHTYQFEVLMGIDYEYLKRYDSVQNSLPVNKRAHNPVSWIYHHWLETIEHYGEGAVQQVSAKTQHIIPKMMFVLLPLFALLLRLFYDRKKYFYVDHAIFSLHFHAAAFLIFLFFSIIEKIFPSLTYIFNNLELLFIILYIIVALKTVYQQSVFKSIYKGFALITLYSIFIVLGFVIVALTALM
ncbi:Protein of unknown function [Chitinophaga sp. CF118]|uniref:DUF3667 domain-containing protein n=1 Tax=Chitinophaga sp. CF118 TaxID=1884367 RepID=UPI0008EDBE76|nr:DUF3667 domain-containing protein [Chitinophaga sp. CF118]SFE66820.1 Protein of unknown function [Chitinophaga sp. CF118]